MKVAFDCKGTLLSHNSEIVVKLFKWFESKGCRLIIWSNSYSYAQDAAKKHNLKADLMCKLTKQDLETCVNPEDEYVDIAVDDENQDYLAAKNFIFVRDIPDNENEFEERFGYLFASKNTTR